MKENLPRRYPRNDADVFSFVKRFVSDAEYSQRAVVTWPGELLPNTVQALEKLSSGNCQGSLKSFFGNLCWVVTGSGSISAG